MEEGQLPGVFPAEQLLRRLDLHPLVATTRRGLTSVDASALGASRVVPQG
jgi:hypothetical protein